MTVIPDDRVDVAAVVVTFNRRDLLVECLEALRSQTSPPSAIYVIDNASQDGTSEMIRADYPEVELLSLGENLGGAGGYVRGMAAAHAAGHARLWLMDDDSIPRPDALEQLLAAERRISGTPLILASRVLWTDGSPHPMNRPWPREPRCDEETRLSADAGISPMRAASLVSLFVHRDAIERYGFPDAEYFIWNDDLEYTARVLKHNRGYSVAASVVEHRTKTSGTSSWSAGDLFYYAVRNKLWMVRTDSWELSEKPIHLRHLISNLRLFLEHERFSRRAWRTIGRGMRDGLRSRRS